MQRSLRRWRNCSRRILNSNGMRTVSKGWTPTLQQKKKSWATHRHTALSRDGRARRQSKREGGAKDRLKQKQQEGNQEARSRAREPGVQEQGRSGDPTEGRRAPKNKKTRPPRD